MSRERIFGTDGVRGRAGEGWLAEERVVTLGKALAKVLGADAPGGTALLAHDGRRSGPNIEAALARGLRAGGFEAQSAGLLPTPGLALLTRDGDYHLGAMVSASHNPAEDNGIKVFSSEGGKLSDELELALEDELHRTAEGEPVEDSPDPATGAAHDPALELSYLEHLVNVAAAGMSLTGMGVAVDCANGAGSRVAPRVFGRLGAQVHTIAAEPDGDNINRACGSTHPEALQREVRARDARVGIALDGDGDRCILVDERGEIVHGDGIMTVLARHAAQQGAWPDPRIVATVMSNRGLHRALRDVGVGVVECPVGDRAVVDSLKSEGLLLGGEQSGHVIFGSTHHYIGDGIVTALAVLRVLQETGEPLSTLAAPYRPMPQVLLNVPVREKPALADLPGVLAEVRKVEEALGEDGRVLLRYSGTEPLARVMVEGLDQDEIQGHARRIAEGMQREVGLES